MTDTGKKSQPACPLCTCQVFVLVFTLLEAPRGYRNWILCFNKSNCILVLTVLHRAVAVLCIPMSLQHRREWISLQWSRKACRNPHSLPIQCCSEGKNGWCCNWASSTRLLNDLLIREADKTRTEEANCNLKQKHQLCGLMLMWRVFFFKEIYPGFMCHLVFLNLLFLGRQAARKRESAVS